MALPSANRKINQAIWSVPIHGSPLGRAPATVRPVSGAVNCARLRCRGVRRTQVGRDSPPGVHRVPIRSMRRALRRRRRHRATTNGAPARNAATNGRSCGQLLTDGPVNAPCRTTAIARIVVRGAVRRHAADECVTVAAGGLTVRRTRRRRRREQQQRPQRDMRRARRFSASDDGRRSSRRRCYNFQIRAALPSTIRSRSASGIASNVSSMTVSDFGHVDTGCGSRSTTSGSPRRGRGAGCARGRARR